jgi:hypothetical protein
MGSYGSFMFFWVSLFSTEPLRMASQVSAIIPTFRELLRLGESLLTTLGRFQSSGSQGAKGDPWGPKVDPSGFVEDIGVIHPGSTV